MSDTPELFGVKDPEQIKSDVFAEYKALTGQKLSVASPQGLHVLAMIALLTHQRSLINSAGLNHLIRYADIIGLTGIGDWMQTPRLAAVPSVVTMEITTGTGYLSQVLYAGTEFSAGDFVFTLDEDLICYPPGTYTGQATCTEAGTDSNGIPIGEIDSLVDPTAATWVNDYDAIISNSTASNGGRDIEDVETYRSRLLTSAPSIAVAGPRGAYKAIGEAAHIEVHQVEAFNKQDLDDGRILGPVPHGDPPLTEGDVWVICLQVKDDPGDMPCSVPVFQAVDDALSEEDVRPLTDHVRVHEPNWTPFQIDFNYWIPTSLSAEVASIQDAVDAAALEYAWWQSNQLGRDIVPSKLIELVMTAGAKRVVVAHPSAFAVVLQDEVGYLDGTITASYMGLEDD